MIYSTLEEDLGTIVEFGPLAKSEICASVSGFGDRFLTHLAVMLSGAGEIGVVDIVLLLMCWKC